MSSENSRLLGRCTRLGWGLAAVTMLVVACDDSGSDPEKDSSDATETDDTKKTDDETDDAGGAADSTDDNTGSTDDEDMLDVPEPPIGGDGPPPDDTDTPTDLQVPPPPEGGDGLPPTGEAPDGPGPTADNPIMMCDGAVGTGESPLIDGFEDGDDSIEEVDGRLGSWYTYVDESSTAKLTLEMVEDVAGPGSASGVLKITGGKFKEYSGVGVQLRWEEDGDVACVFDASYYDGISLWLKGHPERVNAEPGVRIALQTPSTRPIAEGGTCPETDVCYDSYGFDVDLPETWQELRLPFHDASQQGWGSYAGDFQPGELFAIEFRFPTNAEYEVWMDDLSFYRDDEEPADEPVHSAADAGPMSAADAGPM